MNKQDILELCNLWKDLKRVDSRTSNYYQLEQRIDSIVNKLREDLQERLVRRPLEYFLSSKYFEEIAFKVFGDAGELRRGRFHSCGHEVHELYVTQTIDGVDKDFNLDIVEELYEIVNKGDYDGNNNKTKIGKQSTL